ncbi:hypothetical protein P9112_007700 [Eukaryota sp. TZLM1-RC]
MTTIDLGVLPRETQRRYQEFFGLKANVGRRELVSMINKHFNSYAVEEGEVVHDFITFIRAQQQPPESQDMEEM